MIRYIMFKLNISIHYKNDQILFFLLSSDRKFLIGRKLKKEENSEREN